MFSLLGIVVVLLGMLTLASVAVLAMAYLLWNLTYYAVCGAWYVLRAIDWRVFLACFFATCCLFCAGVLVSANLVLAALVF